MFSLCGVIDTADLLFFLHCHSLFFSNIQSYCILTLQVANLSKAQTLRLFYWLHIFPVQLLSQGWGPIAHSIFAFKVRKYQEILPFGYGVFVLVYTIQELCTF